MKILTGHQPAYLPWLGLFHKIAISDAYLYVDNVQFEKDSFINRNKVPGRYRHQWTWLTVPVKTKDRHKLAINTVEIDNSGDWQRKHWRTLQLTYGTAPYFAGYAPFFEEVYTQRRWTWLTDLTEHMLRYFLDVLGLQVEFIRTSDREFEGRKSRLVLDFCRKLDADLIVMGALGRDYLVEQDFFDSEIFVYYQDYRHPTYDQGTDGFMSHLSIVDLLFRHGPESKAILLSGNVGKADLIAAVEASNGPRVIELSPPEQDEENR